VFLLSPKSCTNPWSDSVDRELSRGICSFPSGCIGSVGFALGERLGEFVVVSCCCCFDFGSVWISVGLFGGFGVSWLDRSNR
jgi:hypothetical protein